MSAHLGSWFSAWWHSRKWVWGTVFILLLFVLRWFEHLGDGSFTAALAILVPVLFGVSEYSKQKSPASPLRQSPPGSSDAVEKFLSFCKSLGS